MHDVVPGTAAGATTLGRLTNELAVSPVIRVTAQQQSDAVFRRQIFGEALTRSMLDRQSNGIGRPDVLLTGSSW